MRILGNAAPVISNCEFNNITSAPVLLDMFSGPVFSGNSITNVGRIGLAVNGGTVSGTVPQRSFAGYDNITYLLSANIRVNDELTIPAGIVFKGLSSYYSYIDIYGKLTVQGTEDDPVVFTTIQDDEYGNPGDTEQDGTTTVNKWGIRIIFRDAADDASVVDHAIFRYNNGIPVTLENASPTVSNSLFFATDYEGIDLDGISNPVITGCTFEDVKFPMKITLTSYPAVTSGNVLAGTTGKGIHVKDYGTLSQDVTLHRRDFAGITNIPYVFGSYTVGTSAVLTIEPGVVCKFTDGSFLNVRNGLIAIGGSSKDSAIVFTSAKDDFYGGDTYGDGDSNIPGNHSWYGIRFPEESIDASCVLDHCIIKNATQHYNNNINGFNHGAVTVDNSSPVIHNCLFKDDFWGVLVRNNGTPDIDSCDFAGMDKDYGYGIWNEGTSVDVVAENCWWNHNTGPYNETANPDGQGERVSDHVDFDPWLTGPKIPVLGDVSMNGIVKPYDASLILQSVVGSITLDSKQQSVADVSFNGEITSYDASLILQYSIGLITWFEPDAGETAKMKSTAKPDVTVSVPFTHLEPENARFEIPVSFTTGEDVKSMDIRISSDAGHVRFLELQPGDLGQDVMIASGYDENSGMVKISLASANDLDFTNTDITLVFEFTGSEQQESEIALTSLTANETNEPDATFDVLVGSNKVATEIQKDKTVTDFRIYRSGPLCKADIALTKEQSELTISVFDVTGQMTNRVMFRNVRAGQNHFTFKPVKNGNGYSLGIYIVTVKGDDFVVTRKLVIK